MKRILALTSLAVFAAAANAGVNFNLSNPDVTVVKPTSGSVLVTFSGTMTTSEDFAPSQDWAIEFPGNGTDFIPFDSMNAAFANYLAAGVANSSYTGEMVSFRVDSSLLDGLYDQNDSGFGFSPFAEMVFHGTRDGLDAADNEFFSIRVTSVPEPTSMALLGLGALALLKKRRK